MKTLTTVETEAAKATQSQPQPQAPEPAKARTTKPKIRVEFVLDAQGRPTFCTSPKKTGRKHWVLAISMTNVPPDTYATSYELHHTYRDALREARGPEYALQITAWGDFVIRARVRRRGIVEVASTLISEALSASYPSPSPAVAEAIAAVAGN